MKPELLSRTVILNIFKCCSPVRQWTNGGRSLRIETCLPTEEGMHPSLAWTNWLALKAASQMTVVNCF